MLTYQQLKDLAQFDEITNAIEARKQNIQKNLNLPIHEELLNSPLTPLPIKLLYFGAQNTQQQREAFRVMINFLNTTFEQRVNGTGVILLKESEVGITSTLLESGNNNVSFPFNRNIAHYAFYYKWLPVVDYFIKQDLKEFILSPDNQGLTPLELYFINYRQIQDQITKLDCVTNPNRQHSNIINNEKYLYKLAKLTGLIPNIQRIIYLQPDYQQDKDIDSPFIQLNVRSYLTLLLNFLSDDPENSKDYKHKNTKQFVLKTWLSDF